MHLVFWRYFGLFPLCLKNLKYTNMLKSQFVWKWVGKVDVCVIMFGDFNLFLRNICSIPPPPHFFVCKLYRFSSPFFFFFFCGFSSQKQNRFYCTCFDYFFLVIFEAFVFLLFGFFLKNISFCFLQINKPIFKTKKNCYT